MLEWVNKVSELDKSHFGLGDHEVFSPFDIPNKQM